MQWHGISLVVDGNGQPVTAFTAVGSTGANLATPLPPSGGAMLLGLALCGGVLRRSARARRP